MPRAIADSYDADLAFGVIFGLRTAILEKIIKRSQALFGKDRLPIIGKNHFLGHVPPVLTKLSTQLLELSVVDQPH
jgi:hypothetical protein